MMKKRLVAFGLAGVMLMGMSMNVFAAETVDVSSGTGSAKVEYTQPESYTVKIPSSITISDIKDGIVIGGFGTPEINVKKANKVAISVTTTDFIVTGQDGWNKTLNMAVYDSTDTKISGKTEVISYSLKEANQELETNTTSLKVKLVDPTSSEKIYADQYEGTVQFDIAIEPKN